MGGRLPRLVWRRSQCIHADKVSGGRLVGRVVIAARRRQTGTFRRAHPGLLEGWVDRISSLPGLLRMNNLLRGHT